METSLLAAGAVVACVLVPLAWLVCHLFPTDWAGLARINAEYDRKCREIGAEYDRRIREIDAEFDRCREETERRHAERMGAIRRKCARPEG